MATTQTRLDEPDKPDKPDRLAQTKKRVESGLLLYEDCTTAELRKFCVQRKLGLPGNEDRELVIEALEKADDDSRFELFSDLAAELRVKIYELHFLDLCYGGCQLASMLFFEFEPAIARVSRLLRQETLPVFYNTVPLSLPLSDFATFCSDFYDYADHGYIHQLKQRFLHLANNAPERVLARFQKMQLSGPSGKYRYGNWGNVYKIYEVWEVDLPRNGKETQIRYFVLAANGAREEAVEDGRAVVSRARIEEVLETMVATGESQRPRAVDRDTLALTKEHPMRWKEHMKAVAYFFPS